MTCYLCVLSLCYKDRNTGKWFSLKQKQKQNKKRKKGKNNNSSKTCSKTLEHDLDMYKLKQMEMGRTTSKNGTRVVPELPCSVPTVFQCLFHRLLSALEPVGKADISLLYTIGIQGRNLHLSDFVKYTSNIGLRSVTYKPISFKLGVIIDSIKLYSLIPASVTLTIIESRKVTRMLESVHSFCCKVARSSPLRWLIMYRR